MKNIKKLILFGVLSFVLLISCMNSINYTDEMSKHEKVEVMVLETEAKNLKTKREEIQTHTKELEILLDEL